MATIMLVTHAKTSRLLQVPLTSLPARTLWIQPIVWIHTCLKEASVVHPSLQLVYLYRLLGTTVSREIHLWAPVLLAHNHTSLVVISPVPQPMGLCRKLGTIIQEGLLSSVLE